MDGGGADNGRPDNKSLVQNKLYAVSATFLPAGLFITLIASKNFKNAFICTN